jgi:cellulose synthase/poly-beta-1,6-N-acetylglucosamine synthase-like glycosyltransferase
LNYLFVPTANSSLSQLQYVASLTENHLFYQPRATLALSGLLRGSGMALRTSLLKSHPWDSLSLTEDVDYSISILLRGRRIAFTTASAVYSSAVGNYQQALTQKSRWASGSFALIADHFWPLIKAGIKGRPKLLELAFSLLLLSRPLLIYLAVFCFIGGILVGGLYGIELALANLVLVSLLIGYLLLGVWYAQNRGAAIKALLRVPYYGLWFVTVQIRAFFGRRRTDWQRTGRSPHD